MPRTIDPILCLLGGLIVGTLFTIGSNLGRIADALEQIGKALKP